MTSQRRNTYGVFVGNLPQHSSEKMGVTPSIGAKFENIINADTKIVGEMIYSPYSKVTIGQIFSRFGSIDSVRVMETKKESVKIAFVNFINRSDAEHAIRERDGYTYCGRVLNVSMAIAKNNREFGGRPKTPSFPAVHGEVVQHQQQREEEIVLTQVESPVSFYAHLLRHKHDHRQLSSTLAQICPNRTPIAGKPLSNQVYACRFSEDGQWYRCKVLATEFYDKSYVHYIDYGNCELVAHRGLVELPRDLSSRPPLALHCRLRDLVPVDPASDPGAHTEGMTYLQTQLQEKIVVAQLVPKSDGSHDISRLVLGKLDIHQQLQLMGYARRTSWAPPNRRPLGGQKPLLERVNGVGLDDDNSILKAKIEELELQLSQEKGKVKAVTAEIQRLSKEKKKSNNHPDKKVVLEDLLEDMERVYTLRQQVPFLQANPDYIEDALRIYLDESGDNGKTQIQVVVDGLRGVYGNLLQTKSLNGDSFPVTELATYYRRLKRNRKSKCMLAAETDVAREALKGSCDALGQALLERKFNPVVPVQFETASERLQKSLQKELAAIALESSDVAVLSVMVGLLESALTLKLQEDIPSFKILLSDDKPASNDRCIPLHAPASPVQPALDCPPQEKEDSDDDGYILSDLSSLRQKISPLSIIDNTY